MFRTFTVVFFFLNTHLNYIENYEVY